MTGCGISSCGDRPSGVAMQARESAMVPPDTHAVIQALVSNASVLLREFSIHIDESSGKLCSLPDILNGVVPRPRCLVALVVALSRAFASEGTLGSHSACEVPSLPHVCTLPAECACD